MIENKLSYNLFLDDAGKSKDNLNVWYLSASIPVSPNVRCQLVSELDDLNNQDDLNDLADLADMMT